MGKKCCFTGHRPRKIAWLGDPNHPCCVALCSILRERILQKIHDGYDYFISGMALGADLLCAQIVLDLRQDYPNIKLECALPCTKQAHYWSDKQRDKYAEILSKSDYIQILSENYSLSCMQKRNKYMVDNSDCLIAIWNGTDGGTKNTIMLAKRKNIPIEIINPDDCIGDDGF